MRFPEDGEYVFPGMARDARRRDGIGEHVEPNVWLRHSVYLGRAGGRRSPSTRDEPVAGERLDGLASSSRLPRRLGDEPQQRGAALPERALEARLLAQRLVPAAARRTGSASGQAPQRGMRARQTVAPRSISACAHSGRELVPVRSCTRRTFVSTGQHRLARARSCGSPRPCRGRRPAVRSGRPASRARRSARGAVQAERAPVVAEPLPLADHVRRRTRRERLGRRPALEPGEPARDHALDLRLLQHHLADEDRVRIARLPPRQIATVGERTSRAGDRPAPPRRALPRLTYGHTASASRRARPARSTSGARCRRSPTGAAATGCCCGSTTPTAREVEGAVEEIVADLEWLGIV